MTSGVVLFALIFGGYTAIALGLYFGLRAFKIIQEGCSQIEVLVGKLNLDVLKCFLVFNFAHPTELQSLIIETPVLIFINIG